MKCEMCGLPDPPNYYKVAYGDRVQKLCKQCMSLKRELAEMHGTGFAVLETYQAKERRVYERV